MNEGLIADLKINIPDEEISHERPTPRVNHRG
jgi:hypothetical protein